MLAAEKVKQRGFPKRSANVVNLGQRLFLARTHLALWKSIMQSLHPTLLIRIYIRDSIYIYYGCSD